MGNGVNPPVQDTYSRGNPLQVGFRSHPASEILGLSDMVTDFARMAPKRRHLPPKHPRKARRVTFKLPKGELSTT